MELAQRGGRDGALFFTRNSMFASKRRTSREESALAPFHGNLPADRQRLRVWEWPKGRASAISAGTLNVSSIRPRSELLPAAPGVLFCFEIEVRIRRIRTSMF